MYEAKLVATCDHCGERQDVVHGKYLANWRVYHIFTSGGRPAMRMLLCPMCQKNTGELIKRIANVLGLHWEISTT